MLKKTSIQPLVDKNARPARTGGAVDHIAAATGIPILILGVVQLVSPFWVAPFTGLEQGAGAAILAVLWTVFGALLTFGGLIRVRVVTIFAAEFVLIAALAAVAVMLTTKPELIPLSVHGSMAFFGLLSSGFARLTDKAELKRELRLMREQAGLGPNLGQDGKLADPTGQTIAPQTSEKHHE